MMIRPIKADDAEHDEVDAELARRALDDFELFVRLAWEIVEPDPFIPGRHITLICRALQAIVEGRAKRRLIINVPPRHSKSLIITILFPCWVWARRASAKFICASADFDLALDFNVRARDLIEDPWFQRHYAVRLREDDNQKRRFRTTAGGHRFAASTLGKVIGKGADIIVIDDPMDATEAKRETVRKRVNAWFNSSLKNRLNDQKTGIIILVMQRLHDDDLTGHLLATEPGRWDHIVLPARYEPEHPHPIVSSVGLRDWRTEEGQLLAPERFDEAGYQELAAPGTYDEAGQLQQRPSLKEGGLFPEDRAVMLTTLPQIKRWVRRWDLAGSIDGDYTVGVLIGERADGAGVVVWDVVRFRKTPGETRAEILKIAKADKAGWPRLSLVLPQDPGQAGKAQREDYASYLAKYAPRFERETKDKETRADPFSAQWDVGRVGVRADAPWTRAFLDELAMFPLGKHDDQVDAAAGAYNQMIGRSAPSRMRVQAGERTRGSD